MEHWREVEGFEGYYQVSDRGRVRSVSRFVPYSKNGPAKLKGRILRPMPTVQLHKDGDVWSARVLRLVMAAFAGARSEGFERRDDGRAIIRSDGRGFVNIRTAAEESSCSRASIWACCKGHRKYAGGFGWQYKE